MGGQAVGDVLGGGNVVVRDVAGAHALAHVVRRDVDVLGAVVVGAEEQMRRGAFIPVSPTKAMKHRERSVANMKKKQQEQHLALLAPQTSTMGVPKPTLTAAPLPSKSKWCVGGHSSCVVSC